MGNWQVITEEWDQTIMSSLLICSFLCIILLALQLRRVTEKLKKEVQEKRDFRLILNNKFSFVWYLDMKTKKLTSTTDAEMLMDYRLDGNTTAEAFWNEQVHPDDTLVAQEMLESLYNGEQSYAEFRIYTPEKEIIWLGVYGQPVVNKQNTVDKVVGLALNIDEPKRMKAQIHDNVYYDHLTNLPNHRYLRQKYEELSDQNENKKLTLFSIDIDRFKIINETRGRHIGDQVILEIAERLKQVIKDEMILARESGDEFFVLAVNLSEHYEKIFAQKLLDVFREPIVLQEKPLYLTSSVGITAFPQPAHTFDELMYQSESSMYLAKENGRNRYHLFEKSNEEIMERKRQIELGLKEALKENQLSLLYQPKVNLNTGKIECVEALMRWNHPQLGYISPAEFIPIAEETGEIIHMGYWGMKKAIEQVKLWQEIGLDIDVSVNVSPVQFQEPRFITEVVEILEREKLENNHLIIEITEGVMQNIDLSIEMTKTLHDLGVRIAIDDFGTGYSSLSVLNKLTIDYVKIDKAFIDEIPKEEKTSLLVKTMIQMGENLGFSIIAEGIETTEQAKFLKENNCKYGQGYLYSKPIKAEEIYTLT